MLTEIILTIVILICFYLASGAINSAPAPFEPPVKWLLYVLVVVIAIFAILRVWGIAI